MALGSDPNPLHDRDPGFKDVDIAAIPRSPKRRSMSSCSPSRST